jgi:hypothetical protein
MATLTVRQLSIRDVPMLARRVRKRVEFLSPPGPEFGHGLTPRHALTSLASNRFQPYRAFVAEIDGELCAYLLTRRGERAYRWMAVAVGAGSPRLPNTDDVCLELWSALHEHAIKRLGVLGARRIVATTAPAGPSIESLQATGYVPYTRLYILRGRRSAIPRPRPSGVRPQRDDDAWSIHQLYHHVTPKPVQFAEAYTSDEWELGTWALRNRLRPRRSSRHAFVWETEHGVVGYCRLTLARRTAHVQLLGNGGTEMDFVNLVDAALAEAGVDHRADVILAVPEYQIERLAPFEEAGYSVNEERVALVRHTTVPAVVHPELAPLPVRGRVRKAQGVPSLIGRTCSRH